MHRIILIAGLFLLSPTTVVVAAPKPDLPLQQIAAALPAQWRLEVVEDSKPPYWTDTAAHDVIVVRLIGPEKGGYRYRLGSGESIEEYFSNEMIVLWLLPPQFDDGWTLKKRLANRVRTTPTKRPYVIYDGVDYKIYAIATWSSIMNSAPRLSPHGAVEARSIFTRPRGSWPNWRNDLGEALSKHLPRK
jgi:hypothetical protein